MAWTAVQVAAQRVKHDSKDGNDNRSKGCKESKNLMNFKESQHNSSCINADENTASCSEGFISASTRQRKLRGSKELD